MASWDAKKTCKLFRTLYGPAQLKIVPEYISPAICRRCYTRFHLKMIKTILGAYTGIHPKSKYITKSILIGNTKEQNDFKCCQTRIGAHNIAAVQNIYSLANILIYNTTYYSLGCNQLRYSRKENQYSPAIIQTFFSKNIKYSKIEVILNSISEHKEFKYLTALVNHSKIYSLIKAKLWFGAAGKPQNPYTLKFQISEFEEKNYGNRLIPPFLKNEYNRLSKITTEIGSALNTVLAIKNNFDFKSVFKQ